MSLNETNMTICPNCSFEQEMSEQCEKCGSLFAEHEKKTEKADSLAFIDKVEVVSSLKKRIISRLLIASFFFLLAAWIFKPYYAPNWVPNYNVTAKTALRNAMIAQEAYYDDHKTYTDTKEKLLDPYYGFYPEKHVHFRIISADEDHYKMEAFHEKGENKFIIEGPAGVIKPLPK
jgi:hypothetical protein